MLPLKPISSELHCLFEQLTISISAQVVEQIGGGGCSYGRIVEMLSKGMSAEKRTSNAQFAFGIGIEAGINVGATPFGQDVPKESSIRVVDKPWVSGILQQQLCLPLWAMAPSMQV